MEIADNGRTFFITDPSVVGEARRYAQLEVPDDCDRELIGGKIGVVVTELGTNLTRYATRGVLFIRRVNREIEIVSIDSGTGIADFERSRIDGVSSGTSMGGGLGAIQRQSDHFDIFTDEKGTVIAVRVHVDKPDGSSTAPSSKTDVGVVSAALRGELRNGDTWAFEESETFLTLGVFDGLGHGLLASEASSRAAEILLKHPNREPSELLQNQHIALRSTRGAAGSIARLRSGRELQFCGVGNVAAFYVVGEKQQSLINFGGTLGVQARTFRQYVQAAPPGALLVMHSDGLSMRWSLSDYPGLIRKSAACIAGVLFRDFRRDNDDATVVVVRLPSLEIHKEAEVR